MAVVRPIRDNYYISKTKIFLLESVEKFIYVTTPTTQCVMNHPTPSRSSKPLLGVLALTRPLSSLVGLVTRLGATAQPEEGTTKAYIEI